MKKIVFFVRKFTFVKIMLVERKFVCQKHCAKVFLKNISSRVNHIIKLSFSKWDVNAIN